MSPSNRPRAVILAVQLPGVSDEEHAASMDELGRLADTLGLDVVARVSQKRDSLATAAVVGAGKLKEVAALTGGTGVVPTFSSKKGAAAEEADEPGEVPPVAPEGAERATVVLVDHEITPLQTRHLEQATSAEVLDRPSVILAIFKRHARTREARLQVEIARLAYIAPRLRETGGGERQGGGIGAKGAG